MKQRLNLLIAILSIMPTVLWGQTNNFQFVQYDTSYVGNESLVVLEGEIFSRSTADHDLTVTRVTHTIEDAWSSSFCVGPACLPPFLDEYTFTLFAGDTALFSLDTYPHDTPGVGSWTILAVDSTTMEIDSVHITLEFTTTAIDPTSFHPANFELSDIYPNPSNAWINLDLQVVTADHYTLTLYALDGREVLQRTYALRAGQNQLQWGLQGLPSGNYILRATAHGQTLVKQVSVIK